MNKGRNSLEETQALPRVSDETQIMPPGLLREELARAPQAKARATTQRGTAPGKKRLLAFAAGFLLAVGAGYFTLEYFPEQQDAPRSAEKPAIEVPDISQVQTQAKVYAAAAAEKVEQLQQLTGEAKAATEQADQLKRQAEGFLAEQAALLDVARAFIQEQTARLQVFWQQHQPKQE